jgi:hypothetical protein
VGEKCGGGSYRKRNQRNFAEEVETIMLDTPISLISFILNPSRETAKNPLHAGIPAAIMQVVVIL